MSIATVIDGRGLPPSLFGPTAVGIVERISRIALDFCGGRPIAAAVRTPSTMPVPGLRTMSTFLQSKSPATSSARANASDAASFKFQSEVVCHLDAAYNFARYLSRDADAAQDIVQEAFLRAYRGFDGYLGGDPRAWIFAIVRNCYHDWLVHRRRKARLEADPQGQRDFESDGLESVAAEDDDPETALLRRSEASAVRALLNSLPRQLREILVLREIEGLSYRQIAEVSSLPMGTVMSRLARARSLFQSAWKGDGQLPELKS